MRTTPWIETPVETGWYWHRFYVEAVPIYNTCYVMVVKERTFVHYLGETEQIELQPKKGEEYWGPLPLPA